MVDAHPPDHHPRSTRTLQPAIRLKCDTPPQARPVETALISPDIAFTILRSLNTTSIAFVLVQKRRKLPNDRGILAGHVL